MYRNTDRIYDGSVPHCGYDEEDCITELELVRIMIEEARGMGAKDFCEMET